MDVRIVIRLMLVLVFITGSIVESINITTDPVRCSESRYCKLNCNIGEITETVKWLYNGASIFNCSSPYSAGICYIHSDPGKLRTMFDINVTSGILTSRIYIQENTNNDIWTCIHGDKKAIIDIDIKDRATVKSFQIPSTGSEGDLLNLNCTVTSKRPVDVNITVKGLREEQIILTQVKKSSLRSITTTVKAGCGYQEFRCEVWNGYGTVSVYNNVGRRYKCPHQILYDETNTTVEGVVGTYYTEFRLYFTGYPGTPTSTWYRRDGNHEIKLNGYRVSQSVGSQSLYMQIRNVRIQDAGQYSIHVYISGRIEIVVFTLKVKMPKPSTDAIYETTSMNPTSAQRTQMITGIGIGVGIGVVGTLTLVGIIVLVVWLKHRGGNLTTDTCPTMKSLERNVRKTKNTTRKGVDNVNMEQLYDNAEENIEYENHYVS